MNGEADVPAEFRGYTFESWDALSSDLRAGKELARLACNVFASANIYLTETQEEKQALVLAGEVGTGKSGLASATLMERARRGSSVLWIDYRLFLRKVRSTYEVGHEISYDEIISAASGVGCLLFDDFGDAASHAKVTDNVRGIVYDVVSERYNQHRPTIFTTNLDKGHMLEQFGDRLTSRILKQAFWADMGTVNVRNIGEPVFRKR